MVYKYCIEHLDEGDEKICIERGIAFGSTFSEVVHYLEDYYGEANIESIHELTCFDVGSEHIMPEWAFEEIGYTINAKEHK